VSPVFHCPESAAIEKLLLEPEARGQQSARHNQEEGAFAAKPFFSRLMRPKHN